jgi:hypothetical protein
MYPHISTRPACWDQIPSPKRLSHVFSASSLYLDFRQQQNSQLTTRVERDLGNARDEGRFLRCEPPGASSYAKSSTVPELQRDSPSRTGMGIRVLSLLEVSRFLGAYYLVSRSNFSAPNFGSIELRIISTHTAHLLISKRQACSNSYSYGFPFHSFTLSSLLS